MNKCKYFDCGWCYAPDDIKTNATQSGCFEPEHCPYLKSQNQMKSFNINSTVKVRLTKVGEELHKKDWEDFWSSIHRLDEHPYTPYTPDVDGYVEFQMWDLMEKFGKHCANGGDLPFDTEILIDDKDLKGKVETDEHKLLKECRQTGRTNATTEKVLKTVFSQMTDKKTLECEIEEYALEIEQKAKEIGKLKDILDRKEQQLKQMKETDKVLIEGDTATINGVKYKRLEEPKPETLYDLIGNWWDNVFVVHNACTNETAIEYLVNDIEQWLPDEIYIEFGGAYERGWNDALRTIKDNLR
jgi:hypothetical protein